MEEFLNLITPENFSRLLVVYLLFRFEKTMKESQKSNEEQTDKTLTILNNLSKLIAALYVRCHGKTSKNNGKPNSDIEAIMGEKKVL